MNFIFHPLKQLFTFTLMSFYVFRLILKDQNWMHSQFGSKGEYKCVPHFSFQYIFTFSGAVANIKQLGFEFHFVNANVVKYWIIIQSLYQQGFRVISYDPNFCSADSGRGFYKLFEIVFRKTDICSWSHWNILYSRFCW